jgi:hypothetical protein
MASLGGVMPVLILASRFARLMSNQPRRSQIRNTCPRLRAHQPLGPPGAGVLGCYPQPITAVDGAELSSGLFG